VGIKFTPLKKITAGFFIGAAAMAWAAVVQHYIYKVGATIGSFSKRKKNGAFLHADKPLWTICGDMS